MAVRPAVFEQAGAYAAADVRLGLGGLVTPGAGSIIGARGGVWPALGGPLAVSAPGGLVARVAAGRAVILGTEATAGGLQGPYLFTNDANVDLAVAPTAAGQLRVDLVVARVYDAAYSGAVTQATLEIVQGVPAAANPAEPAVPVSSLVLARIDVPAAAGAIAAGNLTDRRVYTVANGGALNLATAERTALSGAATAADPAGLPEGFPVWDRDLGILFAWTRAGAKWVAQRMRSVAVVAHNEDGGTTTATGYTNALTGSSVLTCTFTASDSGLALVQIGAFIRPAGAQVARCGWFVTGPGKAETTADVDDSRTATFQASAAGQGGTVAKQSAIIGLTPGGVYTATFVMRTESPGGIAAWFDDRTLSVLPVP